MVKRRKTNKRKIIIDGEIAYVPLTRGLYAVIDSEIAQYIGQYNWHAAYDRGVDVYYAKGYIKRIDGIWTVQLMHRLIYEYKYELIPSRLYIDHINNDSLDNRLSNLRLVTNRQNLQNRIANKNGDNTSKFVGVYWNRSCGKWCAQIRINGRKTHLGYFISEIEAAKAYRNAVKKLGETMICNHHKKEVTTNANATIR